MWFIIGHKKALNRGLFEIQCLGEEPGVITQKHEWPCQKWTK